MKTFVQVVIINVVVTLAIAIFGQSAIATDVGGIIDTDTTWDLADSPYNIIADVQIAENVTLTVYPGVIISNGRIRVWGTFSAIGTELLKVFLNSVYIKGEDIKSIVNIEFSEFNGGSLDHHDDGYLTLRNSILQDLEMFNIHDSLGANIEKNIFINSAGITVGNKNDVKVFIRNNIFYQQISGYAVQNWASYQTSETIVEYNSFLSTNRIALMLPPGYDNAKITATNNYWNTTDTNVIDSMIFDKSDDLSCSGYIEYEPFLMEPHPDTPIFIINQLPSANAGLDQIVFDEITLDGSLSDDPDGEIVSHQWQLTHRANPAYNRTANGETSTVNNLKKGFYDVILTVADNEGAIDTDEMFFSATGPKGDFDFDEDVDGDDLSIFAEMFGTHLMNSF